jgi:hypothetical protein
VSASQLAELAERIRNALRVSEARAQDRDYPFALGIAQQALADALREIERARR